MLEVNKKDFYMKSTDDLLKKYIELVVTLQDHI